MDKKQPTTSKIINGDSLEVMKTLDKNSINLTVTSPPYDNLRTYNGNNDFWNENVWKNTIKELYRVTKEGGVVVWVVGDATIKGSETGTSFKQALWAMECGFNLHDTMIWTKPAIFPHDPKTKRYKQQYEYMFVFSKGKPNCFSGIKDIPNVSSGKEIKAHGGRKKDGTLRGQEKNIIIAKFRLRNNHWQINQNTNKNHPAPFPEKLAHDHIISWSKEGDTVLDCFMGSGTTGKMAKQLGRNFIGIDLDAEYCKIAEARINNIKNNNE